jgi:hypothetical protein
LHLLAAKAQSLFIAPSIYKVPVLPKIGQIILRQSRCPLVQVILQQSLARCKNFFQRRHFCRNLIRSARPFQSLLENLFRPFEPLKEVPFGTDPNMGRVSLS